MKQDHTNHKPDLQSVTMGYQNQIDLLKPDQIKQHRLTQEQY